MTAVPVSPASPLGARLTREDVLDAREVADLVHLPISTALDLARRGILPGHKLGRRWIFLRDEIEAGVRDAPNHRVAPVTPQPPARTAAGRTARPPKRYPTAVPAAPEASQRRLFA